MLMKFAVQDFLDEKLFNNMSRNTIEAYKLTLYAFRDFCADRDEIAVSDVGGECLRYVAHAMAAVVHKGGGVPFSNMGYLLLRWGYPFYPLSPAEGRHP
ncbi:hypothetical protein [Marininema halotolerans]|uniref:Phage integrase, N-terminal SAM-like domain n=1 Tax=Marininema halotolerans TaxID=1155944 RepID=A0A1I6NUW0_9BACL|nr:hypothetical protein [Marininema halotolerans]SFS31737.1 hypothetical protein SAMN05444972_101156 [Marininema halotolerans]